MSGGWESFTHSQRSVATKFDVNSKHEPIQGDILKAKPFPSGSNRNISVQVQNLVQRSQRGRVGNLSKPLAGAMNSSLHIKSLLGQEKTIKLLGGLSPLYFKEKVKKINNWLRNQNILPIDQKKELEMTPALEKGPVASTSSKPAPEMSKDKPKGPQKKLKDPKNHQDKGKGKYNQHRPHPQGKRIPKLEPSAVDSVFTMARTLMEFTAKEKERMKRTFPQK
ncbi:hypothetical protein O181_063124 [Austropuccinia psidii MF-1]|uniref:Uncharacterized protein n=1 Tax=Austropuccinia psidii MF-1 TaxID=1389203 RepID=A0A9Q3ELH6_9BASI|nr:hypothetical protein [Austropuccinia psidii MF-1]